MTTLAKLFQYRLGQVVAQHGSEQGRCQISKFKVHVILNEKGSHQNPPKLEQHEVFPHIIVTPGNCHNPTKTPEIMNCHSYARAREL